jgi:hypothetical protein
VRKYRFVFSVLLLLVLAPCAVIAQTAPAQPSQPSATTIPHGDYLVVYRTPAHIKFSSRSVFEQVKNTITDYLAAQGVAIIRTEQIGPSTLRDENLEITEIADIPDVFQKAKLAGAAHVLLVTVDRPVKSWVKLTIQCSDSSGKKLWEEEAANSTALTGGSGLHSTMERMEARLATRIGQPGLMVDASKNAATVQSQAKTVSPENKTSVGEVATHQQTADVRAKTDEGPPAPTEPLTEEQATVTLPAGTIVRLMLVQPINSANAKVGDLVVIPRKSTASGTVTELQPPRRKEKPGSITIQAESVQLINNEPVALRGLRTMKSANRNVSLETQAEAYSLIQSTAGFGVFFLPLFMLKHGEYPVLPAGLEFTAALSQAVTMPRTALISMQPAEQNHHGNPVVIVYRISNPEGDRPKFYCGSAEVARLHGGTQFTLELPPGKYWFRSNSKKNTVSLVIEEGGEYYLRVDSVMASGNLQNPGFSQFVHLQEHDIGELEASEQGPLEARDIKDISKIDIARLSATPN